MLRLISSVLLSLLLVVAGGVPAKPAPVNVGVRYPIKTLLGQQDKRGSELAMEMLNASGGVTGGQPLRLIGYDGNSQPAGGVAAARCLASEDKVAIVAGAINNAVAMGVAQVARQNSMLFMAAITNAPQVIEYDRAFRFSPLVATEGAVFNQSLKDKVKPSRLTVLFASVQPT